MTRNEERIKLERLAVSGLLEEDEIINSAYQLDYFAMSSGPTALIHMEGPDTRRRRDNLLHTFSKFNGSKTIERPSALKKLLRSPNYRYCRKPRQFKTLSKEMMKVQFRTSSNLDNLKQRSELKDYIKCSQLINPYGHRKKSIVFAPPVLKEKDFESSISALSKRSIILMLD